MMPQRNKHCEDCCCECRISKNCQEACETAETSRMQTSFLRISLLGGAIFVALLTLFIILFAVLLGGLPSGAQLQAGSNLALLQVLWEDNPWETVRLALSEVPLVVIEEVHQETGLQVWGMFYYAGTALVYLLVSAFTAWHWRALLDSPVTQRMLFMAGVVTLLIGASYLRLAACCTSNPSWVLDTFLLAKVYTPNVGTVNWVQIYQRIEPWMTILQTATVVGGMAMLYRWRLSAKSSAA